MTRSRAWSVRQLTVAGFAVAVSLGVVACGGEEVGSANKERGAEGGAVKITMIGDASGPTASSGVPYNAGVKAYLTKYAAERTDGQRPVEGVYVDDKFDLATGIAAYRQASNDGSVAALGPNHSAGQPALAKQGMKIPLVSGATTAVLDEDFVWSLFASTEDQAKTMIDYARSQVQGQLRVAALYMDVPVGVKFGQALKTLTEAAGGEYLGDVKISPTEAAGDWRAQAQKLAQLKPNFVGTVSAASHPQTFLKAMSNAGLTDVLVGGAMALGAVKDNWTTVPKALGEKFFVSSSILPADIQTAGAAEVEAAAADAGEPDYANNIHFIQGWIAGQLTVQAINDVKGDPTPAAVNAALEKITGFDTSGLSPSLCFGPGDRYGTGVSAPIKVNLETGKFEALGAFADYPAATPNGACP